MNKRLVSSKLIVSILTLFCLSLIAFSSSTAFAVNFDIGTLFGISRLSTTDSDNDNTLTYTRLPSGSLLDIVASPTALYAMFYPTKQFAIGPEFSYGSTSVTNVDLWGDDNTDTFSTLHLGGRAMFFIPNYSRSSPYLMGSASFTQFSGDSESSFFSSDTDSITSIGIGVGYQFVINTAFVLRLEGQYNLLKMTDEDDPLNEFSLRIGIGTRFGN